MSSTLALMLQITATNGAAGVLNRLKDSLVGMGRVSKETARDFDAMTRSLTRAGTAFAASIYIKGKIKPGIDAAADLEESMLNVKGSIAQIGDKAEDLAQKLKKVRDTGREVSKVMPFSAKEVVDIQGSMLKSGVDIGAVTGARGAAYSAAGLATISGVAPGEVGDLLARIGKQYNFKPQDYKSAADLLMKGEGASPGNLQEVMYSLKQFGSTAKTIGVSFKDSVTMAAAAAPLGLEAGTSINRYLLDSSGLTPMQRKAMLKLGLAKMHDGKFDNLLYKDGKYIGLDAQNALVREKLGAVKGDQERIKLTHDIWGQEGMRVALMMGGGDDLFGDMKKQMEASLGLEERMKIRMDGFNMSVKAAAGTVQTLLAQSFTPVLGKAGALANKINDIADSGTKYLEKHENVNKDIAYGGGALAVGAAGFALWNLFKGAGSFVKVLKGVTGGAAGVAQGKALEAVAGVTPVFVTNMPNDGVGGSGSGMAEAATGIAASAGGGKLVNMAKTTYALAKGMPILELLAAGGATAFGTAAVGVGAAGAAGYGAGWVANEIMDFSLSKMAGRDTSLGSLTYDLLHREKEPVGLSKMAGEDSSLGTLIYDLLHREKEPVKVVVDVKNGNIVAAVNESNSRQARRN